MGDWVLVLLCPVILGFVLVALTPLFLWRVADTIGTDITLFRNGWKNFDCIAVHTACPKFDPINLPLRGRKIAHEAYLLAYRSRRPILLAVGNTVSGDSRMESEMYADFLQKKYGFTNVILGTDPDARDTKREAQEMHRLCLEHGFNTVMRFGGRYHLARISWHWNRINLQTPGKWFRTIFWYFFNKERQEVLKTYFVGVYCPGEMYFFETPFFWIDMGLELCDIYLPTRVAQGIRNFMLHIIKREG